MKWQLFIPPQGYVAQRWIEGSSMPPLGILFLASVLEQIGHEVDVVPADILKYSWKEISNRISQFNPQVVGITTTTENRFESFKLAKLAKNINPKIKTVMGGPHISMAGRDTIDHINEVDILAIGEGERTIVELSEALINKKDLSTVKGIYFRQTDRTVIYTGKRPPIETLDQLPFPARHLIPMEKYNFFIPGRDGKSRKAQNIMTSRGCPFNCYFCATPVNWGRNVRGHSPERVLLEIESLMKKYDAEFIWFYDDTLNYNNQRLNQIMDMIITRKLPIKFACEFRIDNVDKALLYKMKQAGLEIGFFGIEAGSSRIREKVVNKKFSIDKAYQFVQWSKEFDFIPGPFFIFSHYTEEWSEAKETLEIMGKIRCLNPLADISAAILHIYPGTELEKIAKEKGIMPADFSWSRKEDMKKVSHLPAAQGYVPLFKHRLSWGKIAYLVINWSSTSRKKIAGAKIRQAIVSIRSLKDFAILFIFFLTMIKNKIGFDQTKKKTKPLCEK